MAQRRGRLRVERDDPERRVVFEVADENCGEPDGWPRNVERLRGFALPLIEEGEGRLRVGLLHRATGSLRIAEGHLLRVLVEGHPEECPEAGCP